MNDDELVRALWPAAVGKVIASHTGHLRLIRATLVVEVEDAVWQRQLFPLSAQIVARLRKAMGSALIENIEFRIGIPRRAAARSEIRDARSGPDTLFSDEAEGIEDPALQKVYRLARRKATA